MMDHGRVRRLPALDTSDGQTRMGVTLSGVEHVLDEGDALSLANANILTFVDDEPRVIGYGDVAYGREAHLLPEATP